MMTRNNPAMPELPGTSEKLDEEYYYFDGLYLVFTEKYHLKRGFCCQSGCRHCPYGFLKISTDPSAVLGQKS